MVATRAIDSDIRPISDLRNKFAEIADYVQGGRPVIFTRNGYGCMVTMSYDSYKRLNDPVISELNQADALCENDPRHYTRAQSLKILKERRDARRKVHA
mgnify:FL=1